MGEIFKSRNVNDTHKHAAKIAKSIKKLPVLILLKGDLGSGKTEWVKGFVKAYLGKKTTVTSPSYSLINIYGSEKKTVYHADLFRLKSSDDLESTGFWDYLNQKSVIIVEWGEMLPPQWPNTISVIELNIEIDSDSKRKIIARPLRRAIA